MTTFLLISEGIRAGEDTIHHTLRIGISWEAEGGNGRHITDFGTVLEMTSAAESSDMVQVSGMTGTDLVKVEALRNVGALLISPPGGIPWASGS